VFNTDVLHEIERDREFERYLEMLQREKDDPQLAVAVEKWEKESCAVNLTDGEMIEYFS